MKSSPCSQYSLSSYTTTSTSTCSTSSISSCVVDHPVEFNQPPAIINSKPKKRARARVRKGINPHTISDSTVAAAAAATTTTKNNTNEISPKKRKHSKGNFPSSDGSNRRSSIYRGVTRHRWTGRFEAHLWDKSTWNAIQNKKGKQVYLGAYDREDDAARTYDMAALKYWGPQTLLNFPAEDYSKELEEMQNVSREEYLASLRRRSSGFSRGVSKYRGVARHHHNGRWEARIGHVFGNKYLYLGTFSSQEEAAVAYDLAAIEYRGANAVTNFDISNYIGRGKDQSQEATCNCFIGSKVMKQKYNDGPEQQEEERQEMEEQKQLRELVSTEESRESSSVLVNSFESSAEEDPWHLCLEATLDPLLLPEIPLKEGCSGQLDLFHEAGFEDDVVDLILEGESSLPNVDVDEYLNFDVLDALEGESSTLSSSSSSTAPLVLC